MPNDGDLVDLIPLMAPDAETQQKLLVDNSHRLYGFTNQLLAMTKTVLITGSTDGLGKAVAERLARQDWKILLHGRSEDKGTAVLAELRELTGNDDIYYFNADLSSLADTKRLADEILATQKRLDVLINNAGIGPRAPDSIRSLSKDGNELFLSVNYLAGYLLARQLLPLLSKSAPSRVINVASIAQVPLNFDDIMLGNDYSDYRAYSQSKLAPDYSYQHNG